MMWKGQESAGFNVGAAFGYGGREELEKAGAVFIAETVEDLKILAETDDAGKENVSSHHTGKNSSEKQKKKRQTVREGRIITPDIRKRR